MKRFLNLFVLIAFCFSNIDGYCQSITGAKFCAPGLNLLPVSQPISHAVLKGVKVNPDNLFDLEFIIDTNNDQDINKEEAQTLVNYFFAGLTLPEKDLWVNLSPYEQNRIIPDTTATTELGEGLLKEDYLLKQLAASLTYPETELGKKYWDELNGAVPAGRQVGSRSPRPLLGRGNPAPTNNFSKVWIVPDKALIYENGNSAFITEATLKVQNEDNNPAFREHIIPQITQQVNQGEHFSQLRQIYSALILGVWFKNKLKESIYKNYISQSKTSGIDNADINAKEKIYQKYLDAFKQGAYNYVKKESVGVNDHSPAYKITRRAYFSGGIGFGPDNGAGGLGASVRMSSKAPTSAGRERLINVNVHPADSLEQAARFLSSQEVKARMRGMSAEDAHEYARKKTGYGTKNAIKRNPQGVIGAGASARQNNFPGLDYRINNLKERLSNAFQRPIVWLRETYGDNKSISPEISMSTKGVTVKIDYYTSSGNRGTDEKSWGYKELGFEQSDWHRFVQRAVKWINDGFGSSRRPFTVLEIRKDAFNLSCDDVYRKNIEHADRVIKYLIGHFNEFVQGNEAARARQKSQGIDSEKIYNAVDRIKLDLSNFKTQVETQVDARIDAWLANPGIRGEESSTQSEGTRARIAVAGNGQGLVLKVGKGHIKKLSWRQLKISDPKAQKEIVRVLEEEGYIERLGSDSVASGNEDNSFGANAGNALSGKTFRIIPPTRVRHNADALNEELRGYYEKKGFVDRASMERGSSDTHIGEVMRSLLGKSEKHGAVIKTISNANDRSELIKIIKTAKDAVPGLEYNDLPNLDKVQLHVVEKMPDDYKLAQIFRKYFYGRGGRKALLEAINYCDEYGVYHIVLTEKMLRNKKLTAHELVEVTARMAGYAPEAAHAYARKKTGYGTKNLVPLGEESEFGAVFNVIEDPDGKREASSHARQEWRRLTDWLEDANDILSHSVDSDRLFFPKVSINEDGLKITLEPEMSADDFETEIELSWDQLGVINVSDQEQFVAEFYEFTQHSDVWQDKVLNAGTYELYTGERGDSHAEFEEYNEMFDQLVDFLHGYVSKRFSEERNDQFGANAREEAPQDPKVQAAVRKVGQEILAAIHAAQQQCQGGQYLVPQVSVTAHRVIVSAEKMRGSWSQMRQLGGWDWQKLSLTAAQSAAAARYFVALLERDRALQPYFGRVTSVPDFAPYEASIFVMSDGDNSQKMESCLGALLRIFGLAASLSTSVDTQASDAHKLKIKLASNRILSGFISRYTAVSLKWMTQFDPDWSSRVTGFRVTTEGMVTIAYLRDGSKRRGHEWGDVERKEDIWKDSGLTPEEIKQAIALFKVETMHMKIGYHIRDLENGGIMVELNADEFLKFALKAMSAGGAMANYEYSAISLEGPVNFENVAVIHDAVRKPGKNGMVDHRLGGEPRDIRVNIREMTAQEAERFWPLAKQLKANPQIVRIKIIKADAASRSNRIYGLAVYDNDGNPVILLREDILKRGNDEQIKEGIDHEWRHLRFTDTHERIIRDQHKGGLSSFLDQISAEDEAQYGGIKITKDTINLQATGKGSDFKVNNKAAIDYTTLIPEVVLVRDLPAQEFAGMLEK